MILNCLNGNQATFVRSDVLEESWKIFDPLLREIEEKQVVPLPYEYGSRGPAEADKRSEEVGYLRNDDYRWTEQKK